MILKEGKCAEIRKEILEKSGEDVSGCMQCAKCSAGCPVVAAMDFLPHQIIRMLQLGEVDELINSKTPWVCASCFNCIARCPRDLDLSRIMEAVRLKLLRQRGEEGLSPMDLPDKLSPEEIKELPQQVIVSTFRKMTR